MSGCPKNYTWSCQQCSNLCKDYHISKPAPVQSAEELLQEALDIGMAFGKWFVVYTAPQNIPVKPPISPSDWLEKKSKLIESRDAAQRQAGREEREGELEAMHEAWCDDIKGRYAALVEAAREVSRWIALYAVGPGIVEVSGKIAKALRDLEGK